MDKQHKLLIKSIVLALIGISGMVLVIYSLVETHYDKGEIVLPVAYHTPDSPNSQSNNIDTVYITDTLYINEIDINLDPYSCGDDAELFPRRCTADISREILMYCDSKDMGWLAYESEDDKRTVSLICDGFKKSTRTGWKRDD